MREKGGGLLVALVLVAAVIALGWYVAQDLGAGRDRQAQRLAAEADLVRANTAAEVERAANREAARQAGHERVLELLPFLAVIVGALLLAGLGGLLFWDLRTQGNATTLAELRRLEAAQAERERVLWHVLAELRRLPDRGAEVTIWPERQ